MKKVTKLTALFTIITLALGLLGGCVQSGNMSQTPADDKTISKTNETQATSDKSDKTLWYDEPVELTIFTRDSASYTYPEVELLPVYEEFFKRTNIKIKFDVCPNASFNDTINLMLATKTKLPDIMEIGYRINTHYDKGIFLPLEDLIYERCPNIVKHAIEHPSWEGIEVHGAADGHLYAMPRTNTVINFVPTFIRADMFKALNLKNPTTLDELVEALRIIRDADLDGNGVDDTIGISVPGGSNALISMSIGWFGIGTLTNEWSWQYNDKGELIYYGTSDKYKAALDFWRMMYKEKLIDREYITVDTKQYEEDLINGKIVFTNFAATRADNYNKQLSSINPGAYFEAIVPVQNDLGIAYVSSNNPTNIAGHGAAITKDCKNVDAALDYFNYVYSDEGALLFTMGIEGETYEMVNGKAQYIGKLAENPTSDALRAQYGIYRPTAAIREYDHLFEAIFKGSEALKAYNTVKNYVVDFNPYTKELERFNAYEEKYSFKMSPATEQNNSTLEPVSAQITPILDEFKDRYITGETDDWDGYVADLEAAGLATWKSVIEDRIARYKE